ncbi:hypothetical protein [Specibacter sp. RAF43]|uniref:hypothetical protein n=1 Tax=Specibacter sp. RAF43 TaxID=3233057 RepID=UPI003F94BBA8
MTSETAAGEASRHDRHARRWARTFGRDLHPNQGTSTADTFLEDADIVILSGGASLFGSLDQQSTEETTRAQEALAEVLESYESS